MLNSASELKEIGYDSSLLGIDDITVDGAGKTALDRFLENAIGEAGLIIENWIGDKYKEAETDTSIQYRVKRAEFVLAVSNCLEYLSAKGSTITENLKIEGIEVSGNFNSGNFNAVKNALSDKALQLICYFFDFGSRVV